MMRFLRFAVLVFAASTATAQKTSAQTAAAPSAEPPSTLADYARRDAAVAEALELPRTSPTEQLRTIALLLDLDRPEVAALVLPDLLKAKLTDDDRAALVRKFGTARFMELIRRDRPAAAADGASFAGAGKFAQQCLDAAAAQARDPKRLAALVKQLTDGSEDERLAAEADLAASGQNAVAACLTALAEAKTKPARGRLMAALIEMRPASDGPVLAALADGEGQLQRDAAELAGAMRLSEAMPLLAALAAGGSESAETSAAASAALSRLGFSTPTQLEAIAVVKRRLGELAKGAPVPTAPGDDGGGVWWTWDGAKRQIVSREFTAAELRTLAAGRLARALVHLGGLVDPVDRRAVLIDAWEEAAILDRPLPKQLEQVVAASSTAELSAALDTALRYDRSAAAIAAAGCLARRGDPSALATADGRPSPLTFAAASCRRDVRFAALEAVMQLHPPRSFPGASHVVDSLWYFAAGAGRPTAVVASSVFARSSDWAGLLRALGFEATPTADGREAIAACLDPASSSRLELVMLDVDLDGPPLRETVFQLRAADRTARVPILIAASSDRFDEAREIAESFPLTIAAPRPASEAALAPLVARASALADGRGETAEVRRQRAEKSLRWIASLLAEGGPDELIREGALAHRAAIDPASPAAIEAVDVLAALGTADSQASLAELASESSRPLADRRRAAEAFARSVGRFGLQLDRTQVFAQYDRYNASQNADRATQELLGALLDVIEGKQSSLLQEK